MPQDGYRRRMAIQVLASLPDDENDARAVLRYAQELLDRFIAPLGGAQPDLPERIVVPFRVPPASSA